MTAGRFRPDPFARDPESAGARLYRTGDRVRWNRRGELEFLGRLDHQVKLRGFRIELGEVEAALVRHPEVLGAAVLLSAGDGEPELAAFVVPRGEPAAPADSALRGHLRALLPAPMVPGRFVLLDRLPLTPNGKVA